MNNNNFNQNMDGRPSSSASDPSPSNGMNEQNFLQQLFTADVAAMQQQPFFYNQAFNPAAAGQAGMMGFNPSQMMQNAQMMQQQQAMQPNLYAFANDGADGTLNPFQMNAAMQNQIQQQQGNNGQSFQYDTSAASDQHSANAPATTQPHNESISEIGGVAVPPMAAGTPSILHVEAAANAAAVAAAPSRKRKSKSGKNDSSKSRKKSESSVPSPATMSASATALIDHAMEQAEPQIEHSQHPSTTDANNAAMTPQEKAQSSRDRNREHARCTRLRKKAYVNKLKELVDGLHAERSEDTRKRRAAVQALAGIQEARRKVIHVFLGYHARYEGDVEKWREILEEDFWMKQPVTPFRSFRRCEIDKGSRILKGIPAVIGDASSMSVMIETIGSRNLRWLQRKRDDFLTRSSSTKHKISKRALSSSRSSGSNSAMPHNIMQNGKLQHAISSLSSSSGSTTGSSDETRDVVVAEHKKKKKERNSGTEGASTATDKVKAKKVSSSSSSNDTRKFIAANINNNANDFHDYHAPSLPDPLLDSGGSSPESDSPHDGDSDNCVVTKHMCTDSSSGDDIKGMSSTSKEDGSKNGSNDDKPNSNQAVAEDGSKAGSSMNLAKLPPNIARSGGISHNVTATAMPSAASLPNGHAQLSRAPITALPPFAGIGKKASTASQSNQSQTGSKKSSSYLPNMPIHNPNDNRKKSSSSNHSHSHSNHRGSNIITIDNDTTSSQSSSQKNRGIQAYYHINEDDMCMTDDVLMCPFTFRSLDAVWCGALAECVMPGMLRVCFSPNNKLKSVEMIFDAMGFCQQLEHASGNLGMAQIIPNCLEMALVPNSEEARVITLAKEPYAIVSVNEAWTRVTGYTQLDVEGKDLTILHGERTDPKAGHRSGHPTHDFATVSQGISACSVNVHYDVNGREFLDFVATYPLTNPHNEVTHLLHVYQELPARS